MAAENLGEILLGDSIENSLYDVRWALMSGASHLRDLTQLALYEDLSMSDTMPLHWMQDEGQRLVCHAL